MVGTINRSSNEWLRWIKLILSDRFELNFELNLYSNRYILKKRGSNKFIKFGKNNCKFDTSDSEFEFKF